jgi:hypothetical protein
MKKRARRALRIGVLIAGLLILVLTLAVLTVFFNKPLVKDLAERYAPNGPDSRSR